MKTNHIINGDACQALPKLPDASFQAIIAALPYYNVLTDEAWDTQWHSEEAYGEASLARNLQTTVQGYASPP